MILQVKEDSFDNDVLNYCNDILSNNILSGAYTKKAIERFVLEYTEKQGNSDYPYMFIPGLGNEVIAFAESLYIPDIEKKLNLLPWHKFIYYNLFGWVHKEDNKKRRFRGGYISVGRKNSKTTSLLFPLILWDFKTTKAAESFLVSASEKQAEKTFRELKQIINHSFHVDKRKITMTESDIRKDDSLITFFSADAHSVDQYKNSCSLFDEYHDYDNKGEKIITAFRYGSRARKNSLNLIITSAGNDISGPCFAEDNKAKMILDGILVDDSYFTIIYCYDDTDDWRDSSLFIKANPSLDVIISQEILENDLNDALLKPSHEADFKSKTCGLWGVGTISWIPLERWQNLDQETPDWENDFKNKYCFGSLDLSSIHDFTAYTLCFRNNDKYYFKHRFYIPSDTIISRYKKENVNIIDWINRGIVTSITGPTIDYSCIFEDIKKDISIFHLSEIAYDRWNAFELIKLLENDFYSSLTLIPYTQNLKSLSMPTKTYERLIYEKKIVDTNPVMTWMLQNAVIKPDANGNYRPLKPYVSGNSIKRIDGVITSIISLDRCLAQEDFVPFNSLLSLI
jgi:phage terminase large subunit-like protein